MAIGSVLRSALHVSLGTDKSLNVLLQESPSSCLLHPLPPAFRASCLTWEGPGLVEMVILESVLVGFRSEGVRPSNTPFTWLPPASLLLRGSGTGLCRDLAPGGVLRPDRHVHHGQTLALRQTKAQQGLYGPGGVHFSPLLPIAAEHFGFLIGPASVSS